MDVRVGTPCTPHARAASRIQVVGGALLLYFTNSLYEPPLGAVQSVMTSDLTHDTEDDVPLLRPLCVPFSHARLRTLKLTC